MLLAGCSSDARHTIASLPRMAESMRLPSAAVPTTPTPGVAQGLAASPSPIALAAPVAALPELVLPPAGITRSPDPAHPAKTYEAADFTCEYLEAWYPDTITPSEAAGGIVLKLTCDYETAAIIAWAQPTSHPLGAHLATAEKAAQNKVRTARTTLGGITGFMIESDAFKDGAKLYQATMGFVVDDRLIGIGTFYDPASKDRAYVEAELAKILTSWKWRKKLASKLEG
jgi:hypothetical protein